MGAVYCLQDTDTGVRNNWATGEGTREERLSGVMNAMWRYWQGEGSEGVRGMDLADGKRDTCGERDHGRGVKGRMSEERDQMGDEMTTGEMVWDNLSHKLVWKDEGENKDGGE